MTERVAPGTGTAPLSAGGAPAPDGRTASGARRRSPWPLAIVIGFILVALVNLVFIAIAVRGGEPVAESYHTGER